MAFFWVQQWWAVPVILEEPRMGDAQRDGRRLPSGRMIGNPGQQGPPDDTEHSSATGSRPYFDAQVIVCT